MIGGVASGLGDYLNIDPILIRVAFAGLMIFGGAGIALYVLGWLLIPDSAHGDSIAQAALRTMANRAGRLGMLVLIVAVVVIVSPWVSRRFEAFYLPTEVFWALAIALIGVVLLLPREDSDNRAARTMAQGWPAGPGGVEGTMADAPSGITGETWAPAGPGAGAATMADAPSGITGERWAPEATATTAAPAAWASPSYPASRPAKQPKEPSQLGWYAIAGALLVVGVLALVDTASLTHVLPGQYFGGALLAIGLGLVVGAWRGRARLLILLGVAVLPLAATSAFLTVPLEGGIADAAFRPQSPGEIQNAYHLVAGQLRIDLSDLTASSGAVVVNATVGVGEIFVLIPRDAIVEVTGTVQSGRLRLFGQNHIGTALADHTEPTGPVGGIVVTLNLDAGIGQIQVERATVGGY